MPNLPISGLNASAANLTATDLLPVVQTSGVGPVKMTGLQLAAGLLSATTPIGSGPILSRGGSSTLQLGAADAAAPVAQTLQVQSVVAGTSNTAGANFTIAGSKGTGTGAGGSIIFQVAPAGSSGTAQNALATALTIASDRSATLVGNLTTPRVLAVNGLQFGAGNDGYVLGGNGFASFYLSNSYAMYASSVSSYVSVNGDWKLGFANGAANAAPDTVLNRDAADTLALRRGTSAQTFRVYNSYTDASNNEYGTFDWSTSSNTLTIGAVKTGTGTVRAVKIVGGLNSNQSILLSGITNQIEMNAGGATCMVVASSSWQNNGWQDGTPWYIGSTSNEAGVTNRNASPIKIQPKGGSGSGSASYVSLWAAPSLASGTTGHTAEEALRATVVSSGNPLIAFGGTTSSFPALKRSSATLQVRLADDTGFANLSCAALTATGTVSAPNTNASTVITAPALGAM